MPIIDSTLEFCDNVSVAAAAGTALRGDVVDLGSLSLDPGYPLYLVIGVSEAFASAGSATVQFTLATDAAAAIATNGTATVHYASRAFPYTELTAGKQVIIPLPMGIPANERYLGLLVTTATATTSAGSINAYLTLDAQNNVSYPDAVN